MKFENTAVWGFEHALRGMRNPKNSWAKSDSYYDDDKYVIGENDMRLATTLTKAGSEHRKFLRQIFVSVDITAPLYWWKEFDTYKVGTVANSTSTMHKLASTPITIDCFETDDYHSIVLNTDKQDPFLQKINVFNAIENDLIPFLETLRVMYNKTQNKQIWKELIRWLPESWLQTRTVTLNYENLLAICRHRRHHKLNEWSGADKVDLPNFISWARSLPYAKEFIFYDEETQQ